MISICSYRGDDKFTVIGRGFVSLFLMWRVRGILCGERYFSLERSSWICFGRCESYIIVFSGRTLNERFGMLLKISSRMLNAVGEKIVCVFKIFFLGT